MAGQQPPTTLPEEHTSSSPSSKSQAPSDLTATSSPDPTTPSTSASSSSSAPAHDRTCAHCKVAETEAKSLKPCSKCQTALYCGRECQKAGYKVHKKTCARDAQAYALKADLKPSAPPKVPKEGHRGGLQKWQFDT